MNPDILVAMDAFDPDLVARARTGDREALQSLVLAHRPAIATVVDQQLAPAIRARVGVDDLVQETLLRALLAVGTLSWQGEAAFRGWLLTIADNVAREAHRRHVGSRGRDVRREKSLDGPSDPGVGAADDTPEPMRLLRREERFARLREAMQRLSPEHRRVISLARLEGLSLDKVGERMGRSANAASALLLRALRQLRDHFGPTDSLGLPARRLSDHSVTPEPR